MRRRRRPRPLPIWTRLQNWALLTLLATLIGGLAWSLDGPRKPLAKGITPPTAPGAIAGRDEPAPARSPLLQSVADVRYGPRWGVDSVFADSPLSADPDLDIALAVSPEFPLDRNPGNAQNGLAAIPGNKREQATWPAVRKPRPTVVPVSATDERTNSSVAPAVFER